MHNLYALWTHLCLASAFPYGSIPQDQTLGTVFPPSTRLNKVKKSTYLPRQCLRQLPHTRSPRPISSIFSITPQCTQRPRKNQRSLLLPRLSQAFVPMMLEEQPQCFLGERKSTTHIVLQTLREVLVRLGHERFLGRVLDREDGNFEF